MSVKEVYSAAVLDKKARSLFQEERAVERLDGWFLIRELACAYEKAHPETPNILRKANELKLACEKLPVYITDSNVFAGTQRDAFAKSYALINPNFQVSTFNGYCDPSAVFNDIEPNETFSAMRIDAVRAEAADSDYVRRLKDVYETHENDTAEVAYFIEQVTGHLIPDMRPALRYGVKKLISDVDLRLETETDEGKRDALSAMKISLEGVMILAERYAKAAEKAMATAAPKRKAELALMLGALKKVPAYGAETMFEALQSYILLWQTMCMEQAPNPFAFSVGNADRIFEPYRKAEQLDRETAAGLLKHFLVFFNVGDRSWAISQNLLIGGKDVDGRDLTNLTSYALLHAYFDMNMPQPILSVKLHKDTPQALYEEMGRFFFTPGVLTPSLFNDDAVFPLLLGSGVEKEDLPDYSVAGCQEMLIMGKDNANTTNSWLNMAKILELTLTGGKSLITGRQIGRTYAQMGVADGVAAIKNIRRLFYENLDYFTRRMAKAANGASRAVATLPVPFLSCFMGGIQSGVDVRDEFRQGTKYNGSGCLIHGLAIVADAFAAIDKLIAERPEALEELIPALESDFAGHEDLHKFLLACPKYGNDISSVDEEAAVVAAKASDLVAGQKNYLGNPFRPDWSSPTTHLLYGYWVGATPDGRRAREMLGYGVDPLFGEATGGLGLRMLSSFRLPFDKFVGGYASHLGLDPKYFKGDSNGARGVEFGKKIIAPLFFGPEKTVNPFYLYVNVTTPETLRKVLANPKKYAPSGVYIMRIHGTFVNFLDLSPDVQQDIIKRLDLSSTTC